MAACGGDDDGGDGTDSETVLTEQQAKDVLLSLDNVGPNFKVDKEEDDDDEDDDELGCLSDLDDLDDTEPETEVEISYAAVGEVGLPTVNELVASFEDADLAETWDSMREFFEDCNEVLSTDDEGRTVDLDVTLDEEKSTSKADEQLNVTATGSLSLEGGIEVPFGLFFSITRVDNHAILVGIGDIDTADPGTLDGFTRVAVERLLAVIDGEEPSDELVEASSAG